MTDEQLLQCKYFELLFLYSLVGKGDGRGGDSAHDWTEGFVILFPHQDVT